MQLSEYTQILSEIQSAKYVVIDKALLDIYSDISEICSSKLVYEVSNPEQSKEFGEFENILNFFITNGIRRDDYLLVIGGGATSDLGGFVAATILRGISWNVIPTTLLSMIDASIGGKVGINSKHGKNLVGAFHLPKRNLSSIEFLKSLPIIELQSGKGELLKYCYIDKKIKEELLTNGFSEELLLMCVACKQNIVDRDLNEGGLRKVLNFGHTFGHVFERKLKIPHGVAIQMGVEFIIKLFNNEKLGEFNLLLKKLELNKSIITKISFDEFWESLEMDKKSLSNNQIDLILPSNEGCEIKSFDKITLKSLIKKSQMYDNYFE